MVKNKSIVLYPVDDMTIPEDVYESLPVEIDGIPGCTVSATRENGTDVWQVRIYPPEGVRETPAEKFVFDDFLFETKQELGGRPLTGIPGYSRLQLAGDYCWRFDDEGNIYFAKKG